MTDRGNPPPLELRPRPEVTPSAHPPRILILYGSLRERSYSRLAAEEAGRALCEAFYKAMQVGHARALSFKHEHTHLATDTP